MDLIYKINEFNCHLEHSNSFHCGGDHSYQEMGESDGIGVDSLNQGVKMCVEALKVTRISKNEDLSLAEIPHCHYS